MLNQPTAKLGDFMPQLEKSALQRTHSKTEPIYIKKLVQAVGNQTTAGALLGLTGGGISGIISSNFTTLTTELAARYIWERDFAPKKEVQDIAVAVITAKSHQLKTIADLVAAIGGNFQYIETEKR